MKLPVNHQNYINSTDSLGGAITLERTAESSAIAPHERYQTSNYAYCWKNSETLEQSSLQSE